MLTLDGLLEKAGDQLQILNNFRLRSDKNLTSKLTICLPDMHLLERGPDDDFLNRHTEYVDRFLSLMDFLFDLSGAEGEGMEVVQLGDMFDLWQAKWNTNAIVEAYPDVLGLVAKLKPVYVVGNHDIDLMRYYKDQKETFGRIPQYFSTVEGVSRIIYEHGFQADLANNQDSLSGQIGREITVVVGWLENINPDIDIILSHDWDAIVAAFGKYNPFSPVRDKEGAIKHEYLNFYINRMAEFNGKGENIDLSLAVIGHTHNARIASQIKDGGTYYLMDCGSWVDGGHEIGIISGKEMAVCQWWLK
jgi:UDP-2,3-diacylglucosamine pyrophosphatase LpxH